MSAEMARRHIPGVSLAVLRGGKPIKTSGYGMADLEHEIGVRPETVFEIGSVSKQFLATGIMLLAQDGRLSIDDPVDALPRRARSREQMWTPVRLTDGKMSDYGFGWELGSMDGHRRVHHGGSLPGFRAELMRFPDDGLTVIVLTNADDAEPASLASTVARIHLKTR